MYRTQIELAGGVCVDVPTYASEDYAIDEARLRAAITPRTKAMIFNNPTNPTGMAYGSDTLELLARVAQEYDLLIAADEIYTTYLYEGDFMPPPHAARAWLSVLSRSTAFRRTSL